MILLHSAAMAACDAILSVNGKRIVGSDGGHLLRLEQAETLLRGDNRHLFATLEDSRASRNIASYAAGFVPADDIEASCASVEELVTIAAVHVMHSRPTGPWKTERSILRLRRLSVNVGGNLGTRGLRRSQKLVKANGQRGPRLASGAPQRRPGSATASIVPAVSPRRDRVWPWASMIGARRYCPKTRTRVRSINGCGFARPPL
jgi:hypothetical protein